MRYIALRRKEVIKATLFTAFLITVLVASIYTAYSTKGQIILGTEMNTNGMVEYMCLGNSCENLNQFYWQD